MNQHNRSDRRRRSPARACVFGAMHQVNIERRDDVAVVVLSATTANRAVEDSAVGERHPSPAFVGHDESVLL